MFNIGKVKKIEIELSNYCNLNCPMCSRNFLNDTNLINNKNIDIQLIEKLNEELSDLNIDYTLSGVYGDPLSHPDILNILRILTQNPENRVIVTTNGSLRDSTIWKKIANLSEQRNLIVEFSIDGDKDTNHLYRLGANFNKIKENLKTFINNGGNAEWKMIVFKHNEHQVEEIRNYAKELGFKKFRVIHTTRFDDLTSKRHNLEPSSYIKDNNISLKTREINFDEKVNCKSLDEKSIYISSAGDVFPCCFIAADFIKNPSFNNYFEQLIKKNHSNSLQDYDLSTILNSNIFVNEIPNLWKDKPESKCCFIHCSECKIKKNSKQVFNLMEIA